MLPKDIEDFLDDNSTSLVVRLLIRLIEELQTENTLLKVGQAQDKSDYMKLKQRIDSFLKETDSWNFIASDITFDSNRFNPDYLKFNKKGY